MCDGYDRLEAEWASDAYREYQDSMDYELNAAFDCYDGWGDPDLCNDDPPCDVCGFRYDCPDCVATAERVASRAREAYEARMAREACVGCDDVPF